MTGLFSRLPLALRCWLPGSESGLFTHCLARGGCSLFNAEQFYGRGYSSAEPGSEGPDAASEEHVLKSFTAYLT